MTLASYCKRTEQRPETATGNEGGMSVADHQMHAGASDEQVHTAAAAADLALCQLLVRPTCTKSCFFVSLACAQEKTEKQDLVHVGLTSSCSNYFVAVFESVCATHLTGCQQIIQDKY